MTKQKLTRGQAEEIREKMNITLLKEESGYWRFTKLRINVYDKLKEIIKNDNEKYDEEYAEWVMVKQSRNKCKVYGK